MIYTVSYLSFIGSYEFLKKLPIRFNFVFFWIVSVSVSSTLIRLSKTMNIFKKLSYSYVNNQEVFVWVKILLSFLFKNSFEFTHGIDFSIKNRWWSKYWKTYFSSYKYQFSDEVYVKNEGLFELWNGYIFGKGHNPILIFGMVYLSFTWFKYNIFHRHYGGKQEFHN